MNEQELRDLAYRHRGEVVEGSSESVEAVQHLMQLVSVRLDGEVVSALRDLANRRGVSVSELLREGAAMVLNADAAPARTLCVFDLKIEGWGSGFSHAIAGGSDSPTDQGVEDKIYAFSVTA